MVLRDGKAEQRSVEGTAPTFYSEMGSTVSVSFQKNGTAGTLGVDTGKDGKSVASRLPNGYISPASATSMKRSWTSCTLTPPVQARKRQSFVGRQWAGQDFRIEGDCAYGIGTGGKRFGNLFLSAGATNRCATGAG